MVGRIKMIAVVKRQGKKEKFDEKKVYGSVYAACASAQYSEKRCELVAGRITKKIKALGAGKTEIKSIQIRKWIEKEMRKTSKELEFFYRLHLPNLRKL